MSPERSNSRGPRSERVPVVSSSRLASVDPPPAAHASRGQASATCTRGSSTQGAPEAPGQPPPKRHGFHGRSQRRHTVLPQHGLVNIDVHETMPDRPSMESMCPTRTFLTAALAAKYPGGRPLSGLDNRTAAPDGVWPSTPMPVIEASPPGSQRLEHSPTELARPGRICRRSASSPVRPGNPPRSGGPRPGPGPGWRRPCTRGRPCPAARPE